jgi:hypothetical protein
MQTRLWRDESVNLASKFYAYAEVEREKWCSPKKSTCRINSVRLASAVLLLKYAFERCGPSRQHFVAAELCESEREGYANATHRHVAGVQSKRRGGA